MRVLPPIRVLGFVVVVAAIAAVWLVTAPRPVASPAKPAAAVPTAAETPAVDDSAQGRPNPGSTAWTEADARPTSAAGDQAAAAYTVPAAPTNDPATRTSRLTRFPRPLRDLAAEAPANPAGMRVALPLRSGEIHEMVVRRIERLGEDSGSFIGEIAGIPGTLAVLSYTGLAQAGTVQFPAQGIAFRIRGTEDGSVRIDEVDLTKAPECGACIAAANGGAAPPHPMH